MGLLCGFVLMFRCRGFTPELIKTYNKLKGENKNFEVVFASSDQDSKSFGEYFKKMPWLAIPFAERQRKELLAKYYKVQGIPTLVIVDPTGYVINRNGVMAVATDPSGAAYPWIPKSADELNGNSVQEINDKPTLFIFAHKSQIWSCTVCTSNNDDAARCQTCGAPKAGGGAGAAAPSDADAKASSDAVAALTKAAAAIQAEAKAANKEAALDFLYGLKHPVVSRIKQFLELPPGTVMAILDIPNRCKYVWEGGNQITDLTEKAVRDFYTGYVNGSIQKKMLPLPQQDGM